MLPSARLCTVWGIAAILLHIVTGTTPITILAINSDHGLSFAGVFLYRFAVLLSSGGSNSPRSEFWSEFPHFMGMGVVPAPSI